MAFTLAITKALPRPLTRPKTLLCILLGLYGVTWTFLPLAVNTSLGRDTLQLVYWGREWQAGFFKHPPLISWLTETLFLLFGRHDVVIYGASAAIMLASFACVHQLAKSYLEPWGAMMAVIALPSIGYFSYTIPHFNHNIVLILPWCLTILFAHRAIEERQAWAWPFLGLAIGLGFLSKYTILILPFLLLLHVLATPRHRYILRLPAAWGAVALCVLVASPHLLWLLRNDFAPLRYLAEGARMPHDGFITRHIINPLDALACMAGMCASLGIVMLGALGLPKWPGRAVSSADRFLVTMSLGPAFLVMALSAISGGEMRVEWATPFFMTLPILLLRRFYAPPGQSQIGRFMVWSSGLSVAMALTYLLILSGMMPLVEEAKWARFPAKALAAEVAKAWKATCSGPLPVLVGDSWLAGLAAYHLPDRPHVYTEANPLMAPWLSDDMVRQSGAVIVWDTALDGRFRDIDHQDPPKAGEALDWFPGLTVLGDRFSGIIPRAESVLTYPGPIDQSPVRLGLAVIPPEGPCR
ncbi:MAG: glycosyltransferase family 39 protein [Magnetospirillum sp.]|nr:glycosyltransferase family 39 protein [Magnetospirillum sp.]